MLTQIEEAIIAVVMAAATTSVMLHVEQAKAEGFACLMNNRNLLTFEFGTGYAIHCLDYERAGVDIKPKDCIRGFMSVKPDAGARIIHLVDPRTHGTTIDVIIGNEIKEGMYNARIYSPTSDRSQAALCSHFDGPIIR